MADEFDPDKIRDPDLDPRDKPRPRPRPFPVDPDPEPRFPLRDDLRQPPRC